MRQKLQETPSPALYRAPVTVPATVVGGQQQSVDVSTVQALPSTVRRKARTPRKLLLRQAVLGLVLFFVVPWMPPDQKLVALNTPYKPLVLAPDSANAVYARAETLLKNDFRPFRDSQRESSHGKTRLPKGLQDPYGVKALEDIRALDQRGAPLLPLVQQALARTFDHRNGQQHSFFVTSRDLTVISIRHGVLAAAAGRHGEAVSAYLDAMALGTQANHYARETALRQGLEALAFSASQLSPTEARAATLRLESILAKRPAFIAEISAQQAERKDYAQYLSYPRFFAPSENINRMTRVPILRVIANYQAAHYGAVVQQQLALLQAPDAQTVQKLRATVPEWLPNHDLLGYTASDFDWYTQNTARAATVLQQLKAQAGKGK
ncbi:hypothetical protein [Armatimonas rosea]|uniref:Uncharacterized protein n=1 Tax=Armatimonas rosea TaxID=685828 RepID=A0A7W9STE1_ARMRO|nr:hypothetical protein [Armatimonas rosea]MBB6052505.1 hypothetical protein [Armatimonas rosea]